MNRHRGLMLVQLVGLFPIMIVVFWMATEITIRTIRIQAITTRVGRNEARLEEIARRVRADVNRVGRHAVHLSADGRQLSLTQSDRIVTYTVSVDQLVRTEESPQSSATATTRPTEAPPVTSRYPWDLNGLGVGFEIEPIGTDSGLVWMSFAFRMPVEQGEGWVRRLATAALIGRNAGS